MGLDGIEFLLAVEDAFQIAISDDDAVTLETPGLVRDYLLRRLPGGKPHQSCLEQRAFYRLRRALIVAFETPRSEVRPATKWVEVLPGRQLRHNWKILQRAANLAVFPSLNVFGRVPREATTVGETAAYLAARHPGALLVAGEGWTSEEVEDVIRQLMKAVLAIDQFEWEHHFVRDLGVG
jgi:hypothetical protein